MNILHCQCKTNIASFLHHMKFRLQTILRKKYDTWKTNAADCVGQNKPKGENMLVKRITSTQHAVEQITWKCHSSYCFCRQPRCDEPFSQATSRSYGCALTFKRSLPHQSQKRVFRLRVGSWRYAVVVMFCHMVFIGEIRRETDPISKLTGRIRCF